MASSIQRKCAYCEKSIHIERCDIRGVLLFKKRYYHDECFDLHVQKKLAGKRPPKSWIEISTHIDEYKENAKNEAKEELEFWFNRDDLYNHLLDHYDVVKVSNSIFTRIDAVITGCYGRKSKPIDYADFVSCWRDGQKTLDRIARNNAVAGKNIVGEARVNYDLAIVVKRFPQWKRYQEKLKAERIEAERAKKEVIHVNYDSMQRADAATTHNGLDDISALLDEI